MASNSAMLEQMLEAALRGGSLRGAAPGAAPAGPAGGLGDILGGLLGGASAGGAPGGSAGGLGDILGSILGGARGAGSDGSRGGAGVPGGGLGDILGSILGGATSGAGRSAPAGAGAGPGGSLGDILGGLLGGAGAAREGADDEAPSRPRGAGDSGLGPDAGVPGGSGAGSLAKYGGIAVIGMLAYKALKAWQAQQAAAGAGARPAAPSVAGFDPGKVPGGAEALSGILVKAMIAATQADGVIDEDEQRRIVGRLDQLGVGPEIRSAVATQLRTRIDPDELVQASTEPEIALQIYAASYLAVAVDTPQERRYLDGLAAALGIDPGLKAQVEKTLTPA